jgi:RNA polymerase sigma-70 factor (ECF subfamily)
MATPDTSFDPTPPQPNPGEPFSRSFTRESEKPQLNDDGLLLERIAAGDEDAMAVVFDRYSRIVYSVSLRVLRDPGAAEDVLQEIFMQIWRKPESFLSTRGSLGGWLAVVARNRSIDAIRRRKPSDSVDDIALASSFNLAEESERNIMMQRARVAIQTIQPDQRKAVEMAFFDGLTHAEIAEMTGEPLGTVKTRIRTGLLALRKAMTA